MSMFFNIIKKSYTILRQNLIILQPFILFMLIMTIVLGSFGNIDKGMSPAVVLLFISCFCLIAAFLAGWYPLFVKAIQNSYNASATPEEKAYMSFSTLKEFLPGVGKYFWSVLGGMVLYIAIIILLSKLSLILGMKFIGLSDNILPDKILNALSDQKTLENFIKNLSVSEQLQLIKWDILILSTSAIFSYLTMFWFQSIIINSENPIKAFGSNLKALFAKPFVTFSLFLLYWITNMLAGILAGLGNNFLFQLFNLFIMIFLTAYFIMVNFVYFEDYNENNSPRRSDSFR